jgi:hypothetical protein
MAQASPSLERKMRPKKPGRKLAKGAKLLPKPAKIHYEHSWRIVRPLIEPPVSYDADQMLTMKAGLLRLAASARALAVGRTLLLLIDP